MGSQKLLGVIVDQNMNFEDHIDSLCKQLSKRLGLMKHICPYLKKKQREIYFNSGIKPKLMYGSAACDQALVINFIRFKNKLKSDLNITV